MDFHADYHKLGEIRELVQDINSLRRKVAELDKSVVRNKELIAAPGACHITRSTANYDLAMKKESARVSSAEKAKRKRRMSGLLVCSFLVQVAALVAMIFFQLPNFSMMMAEPLLFSALLILTSYLAQREAMHNGRKSRLFTYGSIAIMIILLITYGVLILANKIAVQPNSILENFYFFAFLIGLSPTALLIGMVQSVLGVLFTASANRTAKKIRVAMDYNLLEEAKAADDAEYAKQVEEAKLQHTRNVADAKKENTQFAKKQEELKKQITEKESKISAIGILNPSEYDLVGSYWSLIYNETLQTGRQVDVDWARWKYSLDQSERQARRFEDSIAAGERLNKTLDEAFRRETYRQACEDFIRSADKVTEATDELEKALDKMR